MNVLLCHSWVTETSGLGRVITNLCQFLRSRGHTVMMFSSGATDVMRQTHLARRLDGLEMVALFMDGVVVAQQTVIVVLGITRAGGKVPLGLRRGSTENAVVWLSYPTNSLLPRPSGSAYTCPLVSGSGCWFAARSGRRGWLDSGAVLLGDGIKAIGPVHYVLLIDPAIEMADTCRGLAAARARLSCR
jgi:hypothetical protein